MARTSVAGWRHMLGLVFALACAGLILITLVTPTTAETPANTSFLGVWERTDKPVADGVVGRTWQWGPQANTGPLRESYAESPGGEREVQYFDKSRMEITQPGADASSIWYVTNGLLVVELMTGRLQLGNNTFEQRPAATVNVAGDGDDTLGPRYAALAGLSGAAPLADGASITQTVDRDGVVGNDPQYAGYGVTAAQRVTAPGIDHQVASPFWSFMNASGPVYQNGVVTNALLFESPYFATGLPITEAYWVRIKVGGVVKPVLLQCFERRCLTYTPDNPTGWQVEQGNVGQHYYQWRYGGANEPGAPTATATAPLPSPTASEPPATVYKAIGAFGAYSNPGFDLRVSDGIAADSAGNVYVVDMDAHRVQKYRPDGTLVVQWGSFGTGNGQFNTPRGIAVDSLNNVYVVDRQNHRIQKFNADGLHLLTWGKNGYDLGEFSSPIRVAIDSADSVYVVDADNHRIQKFSNMGVFIRQWGTLGSGNGQFNSPIGIATDAAGNVFVADHSANRIQVFDATGVYLRQWGSTGAGVGQFNGAYDIAISDELGLVYVSDFTNNRVQVFDLLGAYQRSIGGLVDGVQQLTDPTGIALANIETLYVSEARSGRMQVIDLPSGDTLGYRTGDTIGRFRYPVGIARDAIGQLLIVDVDLNQVKRFGEYGAPFAEWGQLDLQAPRDVVLDSAGMIYVTDTFGHRVVKFDVDGRIIGGWGSRGAAAGQFQSPAGIAIDASDNVYVVDQLNHRIQKFTREGFFISAWGGPGDESGEFNNPYGIEVHGGSVYVTDGDNNRVQQFDLTGQFIRQWGGIGIGQGQFNTPYGIAANAQGYLYVVDAGNARVQKFSADGEFIAQFGALGSGTGQMMNPLGIAIGENGRVYVVDKGNARVLMFSSTELPGA